MVRHPPEDAGEEYYLLRFHLYVLQGVVDILLVMSRYWNSRIGWESWTAPALVPTSQWVKVHIVHFIHRHMLCRHTPVQNLKMLSREVIC